MKNEEVVITSGRGFMLSDTLGELTPDSRLGLYARDTRFLSCFHLRFDGSRPLPLSVVRESDNCVIFYAANPSLPELPAGSLALERTRRLNGQLTEEIQLTNHARQQVSTSLTVELGADFADVLELRALPPAKQRSFEIAPPVGWQHAFAYQRGGFVRQTLVKWSSDGSYSPSDAAFAIVLEPGQSWHSQLVIAMQAGALDSDTPTAEREMAVTLDRRFWGGWTPTLHGRVAASERSAVRRQAVQDLQTLRFELETGERIVGAGMPYFMTLFGRDSLLTAFMTLSLDPRLAANVLQALARYQGTEDDPATDQEPGKIPHEVREGELALLTDRRYRCYYGTVDATPLFLILFAEYVQRTGDTALRDRLWPAAQAALTWIDRYGDCDGDGFVEYRCRARNGLENQGWKDSWDAIAFADGCLASGAIALAEVQGYVFDAKQRMAELCEQRGDQQQAQGLRMQAEALRRSFERAFWMPGEGTYALALDGEKRQVDTIASNAAHCLWSGIVSPERAGLVAERLCRQDLFSGWGLRTLATSMARYNPLGYHTGSVWPHDTVLAVCGFLRYGLRLPARRVLCALLDAAAQYPGQRLPELFSGYARRPHSRPVPCPDANEPQAWAAAATILATDLLQALDGRGRARKLLPAHQEEPSELQAQPRLWGEESHPPS